MIYSKGHDEVMRVINAAVGMPIATFDLTDSMLKEKYNIFLKNKSVFEGHLDSHEILLNDFNDFKSISPDFCKKKENHFSSNSKKLKKRLSNGFFKNALKKLREEHCNIGLLANFIIKVILLNQLDSYTNGTTSDTIGLACMDFKDNFDENDFIELIIHQITHMILFMDDCVENHMLEDDKELMVEVGLKYVLGGTKFPLYIAFHSFIVGVEVLSFRSVSTGLLYSGNYHGETSRILRVCESFKNALILNISLFSSRGRSILKDSFTLLQEIHHQLDEQKKEVYERS